MDKRKESLMLGFLTIREIPISAECDVAVDEKRQGKYCEMKFLNWIQMRLFKRNKYTVKCHLTLRLKIWTQYPNLYSQTSVIECQSRTLQKHSHRQDIQATPDTENVHLSNRPLALTVDNDSINLLQVIRTDYGVMW